MQLGQPTARKPPFKFCAFTRVGFSDTDAQGIVYYGRYLPYFDQARVEYHRHLGLLDQETGDPEFVMRACHVVYEAPARFDDLLEVFTRTSRIGQTSVTAAFSAYRVEDDALMCTAEHTYVLVDLGERRPTTISELYRRAVVDFEGPDVEVASPG